MPSEPTIFYSNRQEVLFEKFIGNLFNNSSPFAQRLVVVPSLAMKSWLIEKLADSSQGGVAAGVEVILMDSFVRRLVELWPKVVAGAGIKKIANHTLLRLLFETTLSDQLVANSLSEIWKPVESYVAGKPRRLTQLCDELAGVFIQYGLYGCDMLARWEQLPEPTCWQSALWKSFKRQWPDMAFPFQVLRALQSAQVLPPLQRELHVHLFAINYIPLELEKFLASLSASCSLRYYQLSPCQLFWSDIYSDRQRIWWQRHFEKHAMSGLQIQDFVTLMRKRNPLLANFGRLGRKMAEQCEASAGVVDDHYIVVHAALDEPCYLEHLNDGPYVDEECLKPLSLLQAVQTDMTLLCDIHDREPINIDEPLSSIQMHSAPSKSREVEVLYNNLLHILSYHAADEAPITSADILVMCPDLQAYAPIIDAHFSSQVSLLPIQLLDQGQALRSLYARGYIHLLQLAFSRWQVEELLALLEFPAFQYRHRFSAEDVAKICLWSRKCATSWGFSAEQRDELKTLTYGENHQVKAERAGTWMHTFGRLLMALAIDGDDRKALPECYDVPYEEFESSDAELLGRWIAVVQSLQRELKLLAAGESLSLNGWVDYLLNLKNRFLAVDLSDSLAVESARALVQHIQKLLSSVDLLEDKPLHFEAILSHLMEFLDTKDVAKGHTKGIRIGSIASLHAVPAKVIAIIGMQDGKFPAVYKSSGLNALAHAADSDYSPSSSDADRYLFLETLLSARSYLVLSYVAEGDTSSAESQPSVVIQELMHYLDQGYTINGMPSRQSYFCCHPFDSFDWKYFDASSSYRSLSEIDYRRAQAVSGKLKPVVKKPFISSAKGQPTTPTLELSASIDIRELSSLATNPIKAFFNGRLGIYIDEQLEPLEAAIQESFELDGLKRYQLRMNTLQSSWEHVAVKAYKAGAIPHGLLGKVALDGLHGDAVKMHDNLKALGVGNEDLFSCHFAQEVESPEFDSDGWKLPALEIERPDGYTVKIEGSLREVTSQGLLIHGDCAFAQLAKHWPGLLILRVAAEQFNLPIKAQILSSKSAEIFSPELDEPLGDLNSYLSYFYAAKEALSPCIPEWVAFVLQEDSRAFIHEVDKCVHSEFASFFNHYALWALRAKEQIGDLAKWHSSWHAMAIKTFDKLYRLSAANKPKKI